ncbi:hypothetical protein PCC8801_1405 [Rippkaea orientalis PCC 8801]|uniref:Uncharacterized protein n=1 Tax=Rippkaea orientalis (strain PCC 8801 / RF-1) TaxID=41431 RepID=B7K4J8_RIPO1|nr:hypothetical protein [Rippkaea orientalis]ACK65463.1 hypothetical protein PCC8801_1405 [Rippkaea orientalis PCC 8801]
MNTRYKLALLYLTRSQIPKNKGMAIVFAMAIGVVMALAAGTMLLGSQAKQSQVSAENAKSEGLSMAQVAVTEFMNTVNQKEKRYILQYPAKCNEEPNNESTHCWERATETTTPPEFKEHLKSCDTDDVTAKAQEVVDLADETKWKDITDPNDSTKLIGQYRIVGYSYEGTVGDAPGLGTLTIEGRKIEGTVGDYRNFGTDSKSLTQATSRLEVQIPIQPNTSDTGVPGLWIKEDGISGNNQIQGNIWANDCSVSVDDLQENHIADPDGEGYQATRTSKDFPSLPYTSFSNVPTSITDIGSLVATNNLSQPNTPIIARLLETFLDKAINNIIGEAAFAKSNGNGGGGNGGGSTGGGSTGGNGGGNSSLSFPRTTGSNPDTPTRTEGTGANAINIYEYRISGSITTGSDIYVDTFDETNNKRQKVIFHLAGDLDPQGNGRIYHDCSGNVQCKPTDFVIYGYSSNGQICLHGNHQTEAFILAPNYSGGVKGSGGGAGGIKGSVWLNDWGACSSSTSNVVVEQTAEWTDLEPLIVQEIDIPPELRPVSKVLQKQAKDQN